MALCRATKGRKHCSPKIWHKEVYKLLSAPAVTHRTSDCGPFRHLLFGHWVSTCANSFHLASIRHQQSPALSFRHYSRIFLSASEIIKSKLVIFFNVGGTAVVFFAVSQITAITFGIARETYTFTSFLYPTRGKIPSKIDRLMPLLADQTTTWHRCCTGTELKLVWANLFGRTWPDIEHMLIQIDHLLALFITFIFFLKPHTHTSGQFLLIQHNPLRLVYCMLDY